MLNNINIWEGWFNFIYICNRLVSSSFCVPLNRVNISVEFYYLNTYCLDS